MYKQAHTPQTIATYGLLALPHPTKTAEANAKGLNTSFKLTFGKDLSFVAPDKRLKPGEEFELVPPTVRERGMVVFAAWLLL